MYALPRKAFLLAAGFGSRLRPLTESTPKPMLPLWGRPILDRALDNLRDWGVTEVLVNLHHAPAPLIRHLADRPPDGLRVACVFEPDILGTGGALRNAAWFFDPDRPLWLLNADVAARLDPTPLLRAWHNLHPLAACWLTEDDGPRTVRHSRGVIRDFHDPSRGTATFCGLHLLDSRILPFIRPNGFDTVIDAYRRAQTRHHRIAAVLLPGSFWADLGTPAQYVRAHRDTARFFAPPGALPTLPAAAVFSARERLLLQRAGVSADMNAPVEILPPRGSSRAFFRVRRDGDAVPALAIRWSPDRADNRLYARHTRFLDSIGIPVPRLWLDAPRDHFLVMEEIPGDTLEARPKTESAYLQVLRLTLDLHIRGLPAARKCRLPLMPPFTPALYAWEHAYFIDHFLRHRLHWSPGRIAPIAAALAAAAHTLAASPQALIHRDWQSSNILFRGSTPVMIDFQGMRRGPAAYDLASLLCDPYANLPALVQQRLLAAYTRRHPQGPAIAAAFPAAAIQRLAQALGAYAVLSRNPGMERFAAYIPPALAQLRRFAPFHLPG